MLKGADKHLLTCLFECAHNILQGNIPLGVIQKRKLKKYKKELKLLRKKSSKENDKIAKFCIAKRRFFTSIVSTHSHVSCCTSSVKNIKMSRYIEKIVIPKSSLQCHQHPSGRGVPGIAKNIKTEMNEVLENPVLKQEEKMKVYNQPLDRLLTYDQQLPKPRLSHPIHHHHHSNKNPRWMLWWQKKKKT